MLLSLFAYADWTLPHFPAFNELTAGIFTSQATLPKGQQPLQLMQDKQCWQPAGAVKLNQTQSLQPCSEQAAVNWQRYRDGEYQIRVDTRSGTPTVHISIKPQVPAAATMSRTCQRWNGKPLTVGDISNRNSGDTGGITSQGGMRINSATLLNDRGLLLAGKQAVLDTGRFSNISGTLVALEQLRLSIGSDTDNRGGTIYSLASMQLATAGLDIRSGTLGAKGDFTLRAGYLKLHYGVSLCISFSM